VYGWAWLSFQVESMASVMRHMLYAYAMLTGSMARAITSSLQCHSFCPCHVLMSCGRVSMPCQHAYKQTCMSVAPACAAFLYARPCLPVCLSACLPVCLSACLPVCLSACLPVCLSACLPVCLSACLPYHLYVCDRLLCIV
jgi:hypothetical protein